MSGLRAGQFVTVLVTTGEQKQGLAVARSALVRSTNGQDFVYEHVSAERFEPRPVRVEPRCRAEAGSQEHIVFLIQRLGLGNDAAVVA